MDDIKKFAFKRGNPGLFGSEHIAFISFNSVLRCFNNPEEVPKDFIPAGTIHWCDQFLPPDKRIPDYYPEFLSSYLYRKVWKTNEWPLNQKVFIKPSDRHKRFNGFITTGGYRRKRNHHIGVQKLFILKMSGDTM